MPLSEASMREHLFSVVMGALDQQQESRQEALQDYLAVTLPNTCLQEQRRLAALIPALMPTLHAKWVTLFLDRLFETVPLEQIGELCTPGRKNEATVLLVYIMFMESERMEKQVAQDLAEYGPESSGAGDLGDAAAGLLRARMDQLKDQLRLEKKSNESS